MASEIVSPCTAICAIDAETRLCVGCGRTLDEITLWASFDLAERQRIMAALPARMARLATPPT